MNAKSATAARKAAEAIRQAEVSTANQAAAVIEAARIRAMFDDDRKVLQRRYGPVSMATSD